MPRHLTKAAKKIDEELKRRAALAEPPPEPPAEEPTPAPETHT